MTFKFRGDDGAVNNTLQYREGLWTRNDHGGKTIGDKNWTRTRWDLPLEFEFILFTHNSSTICHLKLLLVLVLQTLIIYTYAATEGHYNECINCMHCSTKTRQGLFNFQPCARVYTGYDIEKKIEKKLLNLRYTGCKIKTDRIFRKATPLKQNYFLVFITNILFIAPILITVLYV